jgi:hypothetical protein
VSVGLFRGGFAIAALLALVACSSTRMMYSNVTMAYSNATPMLSWFVGDYVEMTDGQKDWVRERIAATMSWHRARELPEYRRLLESVAASAEGGFTVDEVRVTYRELNRNYMRLLEKVIPDIADFLLQLDSSQVERLERKFASDNAKFAKENVAPPPAERRERGARKLVEHLEQWLGPLDGAQRELVATRLAAMPENPDDRLATRRYRQSETMALLRAKADRERLIAGLRRLLIDADSWRGAESIRRQHARETQLFETLAALSATLTPAQREHLQQRLRGYVRTLTELSASP